MEHEVHPSGRMTTLLDALFNSLRRHLIKHQLIALIRTLRPLLHFGPWRTVPRFVIRQLRPVAQTTDKNKTSLLGELDTDSITAEILQNSLAIAGILPSEFVNRLQAVTDQLPVDHYMLMHHIDEDVRRLSDDPAIRNVLRAYFRCEPVLLESTLTITGSHQAYGLSEQNAFHFDYAGWDSLNVFVYLSDVTASSSYHVVARGSHRKIGFRDMLRGSLTDDEAMHRFGPSIQAVTGPAGTVFFENTEAFHRRHPGNERRVMLNMLYASHRSWLSHGRASRDQIKYRAKLYNRFRPPVKGQSLRITK